jgi:hypothetical protein
MTYIFTPGTIYYSKSTGGFYDSSITTNYPSDAVEVSQEDYQSLMTAQSNGQVIVSNAQGYPVSENPPSPTPEEIQSINKNAASKLLYDTDWTTIADVSNPALSNPYLSNVSAFITYRNQVRQTAINPPTILVTFPTVPAAQWTTV